MDNELEKLNQKWGISEVVKNAIANSHFEPAPETKRELKTLKENYKGMIDKLDNLDDKIDRIELLLASLPEKLEDKYDRRYASKETEKTVQRVGWIVVSGVIVALLALVLK